MKFYWSGNQKQMAKITKRSIAKTFGELQIGDYFVWNTRLYVKCIVGYDKDKFFGVDLDANKIDVFKAEDVVYPAKEVEIIYGN
jgi:hypothetical protein